MGQGRSPGSLRGSNARTIVSQPAAEARVEMVFSIPTLHDNVDGWGPCTVPEEYKDIPYAPFSKSDRLGKAADWINLGYQKYSNRYGGRDGAVSTVFNFFANDEEDTFHLVDTRTLSRPKFGRRFQQRGPMRRAQEQYRRLHA